MHDERALVGANAGREAEEQGFRTVKPFIEDSDPLVGVRRYGLSRAQVEAVLYPVTDGIAGRLQTPEEDLADQEWRAAAQDLLSTGCTDRRRWRRVVESHPFHSAPETELEWIIAGMPPDVRLVYVLANCVPGPNEPRLNLDLVAELTRWSLERVRGLFERGEAILLARIGETSRPVLAWPTEAPSPLTVGVTRQEAPVRVRVRSRAPRRRRLVRSCARSGDSGDDGPGSSEPPGDLTGGRLYQGVSR